MARSSSRLSLEKAAIIVDEILARARELKLRPMCVAVLDDGGHLKALKREDGASILRPQIAIGKAWGFPGHGRLQPFPSPTRLKDRPSFLAALTDLADGKVVPAAGGLLIRDGDDVVGAVGVSGGTSDEDEDIARVGVAAAGLDCYD